MAGKQSIATRLTAKVGPLPVWAWAAVILGAFLLYTRLRPTQVSAATPATSQSTDTTGMDTGASGSSSQASADQLVGALDTNTSTLDQLTAQLLSAQPVVTDAAGSPTPGAPTSGGPASQPTMGGEGGLRPDGTRIIGADHLPPSNTGTSAAHQTQTTAGVLRWGGLTFTSKAAFDSWARAHGTTTSRELSNHPQARAIYSTLK